MAEIENKLTNDTPTEKIPDNSDIYGFFEDCKKQLDSKRLEVTQAYDAYNKLERDFLTLQERLIKRYRYQVALSYLRAWDKSGKWPKDDELTNVIFILLGQQIDTSQKIPNIETFIDPVKNTITVRYLNSRLSKWLVLYPVIPSDIKQASELKKDNV